MGASDPVTITLQDGSEFRILLTLGVLRRMLQRLGLKSLAEVWQNRGEIGTLVALLYDALPPEARAQWSEDEFAELLPVNLEWLTVTVRRLLGDGVPAPFGQPPAASQSQ